MQKPIKFLYAVLIITIVASVATLFLGKYINSYSFKNNFIFKNTKEISSEGNFVNCPNVGDMTNTIGDISGFKNTEGDIKCLFEKISTGDTFRVEVKKGVYYLFTYKGKSIDEKEFSELINEYGDNDLSETLWEYNNEDKPEIKKQITLDINDGYFYFSDLTFDGYRDLLSSPWMSTKRSGSNLYIFNSKNGIFEVNDNFDYFPADTVEFDTNKKTIDLSYYVGGVDLSHSILSVFNGIPELIFDAYSYGYGEDINGIHYCVTEISKKIDGKMISSTKKTETDKDEHCGLEE